MATPLISAAPHWTLLFAGLCALMQCVLTVLVIRRRVATGIALLDGGDAELVRRIRAHGNFSEITPMALLLMLLLELSGVAAVWLAALGALLVLSRFLHAVTLLRAGPHSQRIVPMVSSITVLSFGGLACLGLWFKAV
jgi:uncharacterized protein